MPEIAPLDRFSIDAQELVETFPPRLTDRNIRLVYGRSCPPGSQHAGSLGWSRWPEAALPEVIRARACDISPQTGLFRYEPSPAGQFDWHLNFACSSVFAFYGDGLLAQDELQVAEHPGLASLREALLFHGKSTLTVEDGSPTPILVTGVERRVRLLTAPDASAGRPRGLYGNNFVAADPRVVNTATVVLDLPTMSNILAIEAPAYGAGRYSRWEIGFILRTAYSGFLAARVEAGMALGGSVVIHTGFWGCGAYGGNRTLMTILQIAAARFARIDRLAYYTFDDKGLADFEKARELSERILPAEAASVSVDGFIEDVHALGLVWGRSDGT
jgi:hypothetical protein